MKKKILLLLFTFALLMPSVPVRASEADVVIENGEEVIVFRERDVSCLTEEIQEKVSNTGYGIMSRNGKFYYHYLDETDPNKPVRVYGKLDLMGACHNSNFEEFLGATLDSFVLTYDYDILLNEDGTYDVIMGKANDIVGLEGYELSDDTEFKSGITYYKEGLTDDPVMIAVTADEIEALGEGATPKTEGYYEKHLFYASNSPVYEDDVKYYKIEGQLDIATELDEDERKEVEDNYEDSILSFGVIVKVQENYEPEEAEEPETIATIGESSGAVFKMLNGEIGGMPLFNKYIGEIPYFMAETEDGYALYNYKGEVIIDNINDDDRVATLPDGGFLIANTEGLFIYNENGTLLETIDIENSEDINLAMFSDYSVLMEIMDTTYDYRVYKTLEGSNQNYTNADLKFRFSGARELLAKVYVGDSELAADAYTVEEGSTIITLKDSYLKTLKKGTYTLKVTYADGGYASASFVVSENPPTVDNIVMYFGIGLVSISALGLALVLRKKILG